MRKRVDHDATQEVSSSQLVPDRKPPVNVPNNDASMWLSAPVSADDFVSAPTKRKSEPRGSRGLVVGLTVVALLGVTGAGVWYAFLKERPKTTAPYASTPGTGSAAAATSAPASPTGPSTTPATGAPVVTTATGDAGVALAGADAAIANGDAGAPAASGALEADAVSAADPAPKKQATKKRSKTKKKIVKKKSAAAHKRR